ncbi:hypothetical protein MRX96_008762 [Rhipicephalus microplus]
MPEPKPCNQPLCPQNMHIKSTCNMDVGPSPSTVFGGQASMQLDLLEDRELLQKYSHPDSAKEEPFKRRLPLSLVAAATTRAFTSTCSFSARVRRVHVRNPTEVACRKPVMIEAECENGSIGVILHASRRKLISQNES